MIKRVMSTAALFGLSAAAPAAVVKVDFTGYIAGLSDSVKDSFDPMDEVQGWFTYDSADPGEAWYPGGTLDPAVRYFPRAPIAGSLSVGTYKVTYREGARMFVMDDQYGVMDRIIFEDYSALADPVASLPYYDMFLNWQGDADRLSGLQLPDDQSAYDRFGGVTGVIDWGYTNTGANRLVFGATDVRVSVVPEPATWLMMIGGIAMVGGAMRRTIVAFA